MQRGTNMYISKVVIKNYRNYEEFSIELKPFVTVIGENNIGKSNLLEAISLVLSHDFSVYKKRKLEIGDFNYHCIDKFKNSIIEREDSEIIFPEVRVDLYFLDPDEEQEAVINDCWYDFNKKEARISYVYSFKGRKKDELLKQYDLIIVQKQSEGIDIDKIKNYIDFPIEEYDYAVVCGCDDKPMDNYWLKLMKMEYLDALRDAKIDLNSNNSNKLLYRILRDRENDDYVAIKKKMVELDETIKSDKMVLDSLRKNIGHYLKKLSMETETSSNKINFEFSSLELSEILKKIGIQYGDEAVSIERNGLGRNNLLYMAVVLAHLYEKQSNYFRIIAIEEPEAHLCPLLQKHLAKNLVDENNNRRQIIITTHSTHIASYLNLENIVVLFKNRDKVESHYLLDGFGDYAKEKRSINYLKKWLNATNSSMFYTRNIIFVEGIAEQILIPVFFEYKYGKTIEKANCQVINVNGVAFEHFLKIVKNGYFVKTVVITDSDSDKATSNRAIDLKSTYDSDQVKVFMSEQTTFEKDIFSCNSAKKKNREFLVDIIKKIRPKKCNESFCDKQIEKLDVEVMFECIEDFKSDFAFDLSDALINEMKENTKVRKFVIPNYISNALDFIEGVDTK